jgi:acyl carrier protein
MEETLAAVWKHLLRLDRVGRNDNFFEVGGHSIVAMQMMVRVKSLYPIDIPMSHIFEFPTIKMLAAEIDRLRDAQVTDRIVDGGQHLEELVTRIASMSEGKVQELMSELRMRQRP